MTVQLVPLLLQHALLGYPVVGGQYTAYEERTAIPQPDLENRKPKTTGWWIKTRFTRLVACTKELTTAVAQFAGWAGG